MSGILWSTDELRTLRDEYPVNGALHCAALLGRSVMSARAATKAHKIRRIAEHVRRSRGSSRVRPRDAWAAAVALETCRRAHAEVGCRVRLVVPHHGLHRLATQRSRGLLLDPVPHTVGYYAAGCTTAQIRDDIIQHVRLLSREQVAA